MNELHARIAASFQSQGLMTTLGARLARVDDGEVLAYPVEDAPPQLVALMQATIVNVAP
jgi:hypothetical protein